MMGVSTSAYLCSWALSAAAQFAATALLVAAVTARTVYQCARRRPSRGARGQRGTQRLAARSAIRIVSPPIISRPRKSDPTVIFAFFSCFGAAASSFAFLVRRPAYSAPPTPC